MAAGVMLVYGADKVAYTPQNDTGRNALCDTQAYINLYGDDGPVKKSIENNMESIIKPHELMCFLNRGSENKGKNTSHKNIDCDINTDKA